MLISSAKASRIEQDRQLLPTLDMMALLPTCEHQARAKMSFVGEFLASTTQTATLLPTSGGEAEKRLAIDFISNL